MAYKYSKNVVKDVIVRNAIIMIIRSAEKFLLIE